MVCKRLIVKNQILQGSFLNGLQDKAVCAVDRGDHLDRPPLQDDRLPGTVPGADTAAEADSLVDDQMFYLMPAVPVISAVPVIPSDTACPFSSMEIARMGQTFSHLPQDTQSSRLI